jgi:hypothetical protein
MVQLIAKIYSTEDRGVCTCGALVDHTNNRKQKHSRTHLSQCHFVHHKSYVD